MKTLKSLSVTIVALAILLSACGLLPNSNVAQSQIEREVNPTVPREDAQILVEGNNAFAFDLYQSLNEEDGNIIFSPYSTSLALAMTYAGARGETEAQMAKVLHFDLPQDNLHPAFNALDLALEQINAPSEEGEDEDPTQLNIANSLWAQETYPFQQGFLDTIAKNYGSGIRLVDFVNRSEPVRQDINAWIEKETNGKFRDSLQAGTPDSSTRLLLANAIYLKAKWFYPFSEANTFDEEFNLLDGSVVNVPMMHQTSTFRYGKGKKWQAISLPYDKDISMLIILPDRGYFKFIEKKLNLKFYEEIADKLFHPEVILALPKFTFENSRLLSGILPEMGMPHPFTPGLADFSGMTGNRDLNIGDILHKALISVDEKSTEASAVTIVIKEVIAVEGPKEPPVRLNIDRPFIFVIRDTVNGQILFIGRVLNPLE